MEERKSKRGDRCETCGRPRGIEQRRKSFGLHPTPSIPRTGDPNDTPLQIHNDLICNVSVYRNGGTSDDSHLCNECLRVALRAIKVEVSALLGELDGGHDIDAEIARLTERLALLQAKHSNVCFDHNRMQERMRDLLPHVRRGADREVVRMAEWEATRGPASSTDESAGDPARVLHWSIVGDLTDEQLAALDAHAAPDNHGWILAHTSADTLRALLRGETLSVRMERASGEGSDGR